MIFECVIEELDVKTCVLLRGYKLKSKQNFRFYTSDEPCTRYTLRNTILFAIY